MYGGGGGGTQLNQTEDTLDNFPEQLSGNRLSKPIAGTLCNGNEWTYMFTMKEINWYLIASGTCLK